MGTTRDKRLANLIRAGELEVSGENQGEIASYFDTAQFRFHGPDGFEADYTGLMNYLKAVRAAFDDRSIRRGVVVAEADYIACQTWIEGTFVREFTRSPAGTLAPNGQRVIWDLLNIFRFDDQGGWSRSGHGRIIGVFSGSSELQENSQSRTPLTQWPRTTAAACVAAMIAHNVFVFVLMARTL
jgi:hypothetical protein